MSLRIAAPAVNIPEMAAFVGAELAPASQLG